MLREDIRRVGIASPWVCWFALFCSFGATIACNRVAAKEEATSATSATASAGPSKAEPAQAPVDLAKVKCPVEMAPIWSVGGCIDRWEASAGPGALGGPDGVGTTLVARAEAKRKPLANVTYEQATAACKNAGKRLCKDTEWRAACRNHPKTESHDYYTYGDVYEDSRCHDWAGSDGAKKGVATTGAYPGCQNPQGVFDLTGNLGELTDGALKVDRRVVLGGTYQMTRHDSACDSSSYRVAVDAAAPDIGFRCCSSALSE